MKTYFLGCTLLVGAGGAIGAMSRFWIAQFCHEFFGSNFPIGTVIVNVLGSFLMGLLAVTITGKLMNVDQMRSFLLIGILGGFTTFSTFSLDSWNLFSTGHTGLALLNVIGTVVLCLAAVAVGGFIGYRIVG